MCKNILFRFKYNKYVLFSNYFNCKILEISKFLSKIKE